MKLLDLLANLEITLYEYENIYITKFTNLNMAQENCQTVDIYCAQPLEVLIHINFTHILTPTRPNNE